VNFSEMPLGLGLIFAFIGGLVSFISPCVLPLVPAYISYMSGRVTATVSAQVSGSAVTAKAVQINRWIIVMNGVAFVAGFTFVFVLFGLLTTIFIQVIGGSNISTLEGVIGRIGGVIIIFFGLHFMGVVPALFKRFRQYPTVLASPITTVILALAGVALLLWGFANTVFIWDAGLWASAQQYGTLWAPAAGLIAVTIYLLILGLGGAFTQPGVFWNKTMNTLEYALYSDTRRQMDAEEQQGFVGSALMGVIFAAGWTPCIGPIYGGILTMAVATGNVLNAGVLLAIYCIGLGVPFLLTAAMLDSAQALLRRVSRHMQTIKLVSGGFLVLIGIMIASGQLQSLSASFAAEYGDFTYEIEEGAQGLLEGVFGIGETPAATATQPTGLLSETGTPQSAIDLSDGATAMPDDESPIADLLNQQLTATPTP
jgi:cytochrome c-type biogenesis protein